MSLSKIHILASLFLAIFFLRGAVAHDIQASNVTVCIRSSGIDLELTMALASGTLMIALPNEPLAITPNTFQDYADRLQSIAPALLTVITNDKSNSAPDSASVSITDETDIRYTLHFPRPPRGPFTIHAGYLDKMPATHIASFRVLSGRGDDLGFGDVRPDYPDFEIKTTGIDTPSTFPATRAPVAPLAAQQADNFPALIRTALAAAILLIVFLGWKAIRNRPSRPT